MNKLNICLFTNNISPGIANIIRIIESAGIPFHVVADEKASQPLADHDSCYPMVNELKKDFLHCHKTSAIKDYSILFFTWAHWVPYTTEQVEKLREYIKKADRIVLLYDASFGSHLKRIIQQIRDLRKFQEIFRKVDEVCYLTEYPSLDFFSIFKKKYPYHASPMQAFVFDQTLSDSLYNDYDTRKRRKYFATVAGTKGPEFRQHVCSEIYSFIKTKKDVDVVDFNDKSVPNLKTILWAFGDNTLGFNKYFQAMRDSDFVFCLPGTYWTPRPVESTACGAIPIIGDDYLHSYDIPFEDGINCVIIKNCKNTKNWSTTLKKILTFSEHQILSMRKNIHDIRKTHLLPEKYLERQRIRYGL